MYAPLLTIHSFLRYFVLLMLIVVIVKAFMGMMSKQPFGKADNLLSLALFSLTHTQFLVGILLYFTSPFVQFSGAAMKDPSLRYWTTEHNVMMVAAVILITMARTTMKKMTDDAAKFRRLLIFNGIALFIILAAIGMSKRGFFGLPATVSN